MDAANSAPAVEAPTEPVTQPADQLPKQAPEKELLCTICNLRACWEAPAPPVDAPAATP